MNLKTLGCKFIIASFFLLCSEHIIAQCLSCDTCSEELVYNGDFSLGNVGFSTDYQFSQYGGSGKYGVAKNGNNANPNGWAHTKDKSGTGNLIWFDQSNAFKDLMWGQKISSIQPNTNYTFSCWIATLSVAQPAIIRIRINGVNISNNISAPVTPSVWRQVYIPWYSGNDTVANIQIINTGASDPGYDIGIDNISFREYYFEMRTYKYKKVSICPGVKYQLPGGSLVSTPGIYRDTFKSYMNCDSIIVTTLLNYNQALSSRYVSICSGDSLKLTGGRFAYNSGIYYDTLKSFNNCDSIVSVHLSVNNHIVTQTEIAICKGQTFKRPLGKIESTSGLYLDTLIRYNGCDSIVVSKLQILDIQSHKQISFCNHQSYRLSDGREVQTPGLYNYTDTFKSYFGCDSLVFVELKLLPVLYKDTAISICFGQKFQLPDGTFVDTIGKFIYRFTSSNGCDSVVTFSVSVFHKKDSLFIENISCFGQNDGKVRMSMLHATPPVVYTLLQTDSNETGIFNGLKVAQYRYKIKDSDNCFAEGQFIIQEPESIQIDFNKPNYRIKYGDSVQIEASSNFKQAKFKWTLTDTNANITDSGSLVRFKLLQSAYIKLKIEVLIDGQICELDTFVFVEVIPYPRMFIPNSFTPNSDGENDRLEVVCPHEYIDNFEIQIFNRWGEKLYESTDSRFSWDGNYRDVLVMNGVYIYVIKCRFNKDSDLYIFRGTLHINY